jgi:hypothetical protein
MKKEGLIGFAIGLGALYLTIYVAGKAWNKATENK